MNQTTKLQLQAVNAKAGLMLAAAQIIDEYAQIVGKLSAENAELEAQVKSLVNERLAEKKEAEKVTEVRGTAKPDFGQPLKAAQALEWERKFNTIDAKMASAIRDWTSGDLLASSRIVGYELDFTKLGPKPTGPDSEMDAAQLRRSEAGQSGGMPTDQSPASPSQ